MLNEKEIALQLARTIAWETFSATPETPDRIAAIIENTIKHLLLDDGTRKRIAFVLIPEELKRMEREIRAASDHVQASLYRLVLEERGMTV
jgi:hypothetical protein